MDKKLSLDALVSKCTEIMGKYVDYLFFEELNPEQYTEKLIINLMTNITNIISHKYLPINFSNIAGSDFKPFQPCFTVFIYRANHYIST